MNTDGWGLEGAPENGAGGQRGRTMGERGVSVRMTETQEGRREAASRARGDGRQAAAGEVPRVVENRRLATPPTRVQGAGKAGEGARGTAVANPPRTATEPTQTTSPTEYSEKTLQIG